jgi:hypothetical protein
MGLITKHFYTATPPKVAYRKEQISKLGQQKPAQCQNRQIQQQGAVPAKYKIDRKKDRNFCILSSKLFIATHRHYQ